MATGAADVVPSHSVDADDTGACAVCHAQPANTVVMPCGDFVVCHVHTAEGMGHSCPACGWPIASLERLF